MAQSLFQMATQGKNVAAAIFWMKARAGWREKQQVGHTGGATPFVIYAGVPRGDRTAEEWQAEYAPKPKIEYSAAE